MATRFAGILALLCSSVYALPVADDGATPSALSAAEEAAAAAAALALEDPIKTDPVEPDPDPNAAKVTELPPQEVEFRTGGEGVHSPVDFHDSRGEGQKFEPVALPPVMDTDKKDANGIDGGVLEINREDMQHPMEIKTPLPFQKGYLSLCEQNTVIDVKIPSAQKLQESDELPTLPGHFGCTSENEVSSEKASPSVSWTGLYEDVTDVTLQMISMGPGPECPGPLPGAGENTGAGKILWHVTDIKPKKETIFNEGASHDTRTLNGGKEQPNQWMEEYYSGPCPPIDYKECYRFMVVAHRGEGKKCQCGHADVLFTRPREPDMPFDYIYNGTVFDGESKLEAITAEDAALINKAEEAALAAAKPDGQPFFAGSKQVEEKDNDAP